jgi:hypothetical protein
MEITTAPGMYAEIYVPENKKGSTNVTVIPRSALMKGSSLPGVLVVKDNNTSELRMIRLGAEQNGGSKVAVISGLNPGDKIIDNPPAGVTAGWMPTTPTTTAAPVSATPAIAPAAH